MSNKIGIQTLTYNDLVKHLDSIGNQIDSIIDNPEPDLRQIALAYELLDDMINYTKDFVKYSNDNEQNVKILLESQTSYNRIQIILSQKASNFWQAKFYELAERIGLRDD